MGAGRGGRTGNIVVNATVGKRRDPGARARRAPGAIVWFGGWLRRYEEDGYCRRKIDRQHNMDADSESWRGWEEGRQRHGRPGLLGCCCQRQCWQIPPTPSDCRFMIRRSGQGGGRGKRMATTTRTPAALMSTVPTMPYKLPPRGQIPWQHMTTALTSMLTGTDSNFRNRPWIKSPNLRTIVWLGAMVIARDMVIYLSCWFSANFKVSLWNDRWCSLSHLSFLYHNH